MPPRLTRGVPARERPGGGLGWLAASGRHGRITGAGVQQAAARRRCMRFSLTRDHRGLDGVPATQPLAEMRDYLEALFRLSGG